VSRYLSQHHSLFLCAKFDWNWTIGCQLLIYGQKPLWNVMAARQLEFQKDSFLVMSLPLCSKSAAVYQISPVLDDCSLKYCNLTIFKMAAVHHLEFVVMWWYCTRELIFMMQTLMKFSHWLVLWFMRYVECHVSTISLETAWPHASWIMECVNNSEFDKAICIAVMWRWHMTKSRNRKIIRLTSLNEYHFQRSAVGPSLSLAQRSGTHCQTSSATHRYRLTVSVASLKHFCYISPICTRSPQ